MKRTGIRLIVALLILVMCFSVLPTVSFAWKNLTHVNSADLILLELRRSAFQHYGMARVTVYAPYENGTGYSYQIPLEFQEALFLYPDAFRAGSMGPDFYPDMLTGQGFIHPYDSANSIGSGEWIKILCDSVNNLPKDSKERREALAFTLGFMLHFCGDMFGHDFINSFAGGTYPSLTDVEYTNSKDANLNIILSHMSEETYMDSLVNWQFYHDDDYIDIAAPLRFVADTLVLDGNINNGAAEIFEKYGSVPAQYEVLVNLRTKLYKKANEWRPSTEVLTAAAVKYLDAWIKDLDAATYALVKCFDNMANKMVTVKKPDTVGIVYDELNAWVDEYGKYITPVPDIVVDGLSIPTDWIDDILDKITEAIGLSEFVKDAKAWMKEQLLEIALTAIGATGLNDALRAYTDRMEKPQVQLDHSDNPFKPAENNFSEFKEYMDRYAEEQKKLDNLDVSDLFNGTDGGALNELLDSDLEAFYNTMVMFKLILMGPDNFSQFINDLSDVSQNVYQNNTANLSATSLELKIRTNNSDGAGTDDNIYAVVYKVENGNKKRLIKKLLDISNYDDFEREDNDTYTVELTEAVRLDQLEISIEQEKTATTGNAWDCAEVVITPMHAGVKLMDGIGVGGNAFMDSNKTWDLNFQKELQMRSTEKPGWTVTGVSLYIKTKENPDVILDGYGTDADVYLDVYDGNSKKISYLLNKPGNDFENNKDDTYYVPLNYYDSSAGTYKAIPLSNLRLDLRHKNLTAISDKWTPEQIKVTLYHGEIDLTKPMSFNGKTLNDSSMTLNLKNSIASNYSSSYNNFKPISLSYQTALDDGLASYVNSLDDSRQWENNASILWGDSTVRKNVFFKIFKGFSPEIEYNGAQKTIYQNEAFDLDNIMFLGMWNGVREERRNQIKQMPTVKGTATISFINHENKKTACSVDQSVNGQAISLQNYSNAALVPGVYDVKITYTADSDNPQYADAEQVFEEVLTVKGITATPEITYDEDTFTVQAAGNGTVILYVDGVEVTNPYTFEQTDEEQEFTVTATAQESDKRISDTATAVIIVPALMEVTDPPVLTYYGDTFTVEATGNGTVILYIDGEEVENPYIFEQTYDERQYTVSATAQEEGKAVSDPVSMVVIIPALEVDPPEPEKTATPEIIYDDDTFTVQAAGKGTVILYVDGVEVENPHIFEQSEEEEITYTVTATAQEEGKLISDTATLEVIVPPKNPETPGPQITAIPTITYDEKTFTVQATGNGAVILYVDGEEVENPYIFEQCDEDKTYTVTATAQEEGKLISDTAKKVITVPAKEVEPPTPDKTATPVIMYNEDTFTVQAAGNGTVILYVDGVEVTNPYIFEQGDEDKTNTVTATAQEEGKLISNTATKEITIPAKSPVEPVSYTVTYTDGVYGIVIFPDQTSTAAYGDATPGFMGALSRPGYIFMGWSPAVVPIVTGDATYTAVWEKDSNSGYADIPAIVFPVNVLDITVAFFPVNVLGSENGKVEANCTFAIPGTTVMLTVVPEKGYVSADLTVKCGGSDIKLTENNGKYQFIMPYGAVTVTGSFEAVNPYNDVDTGDWFYDDVLYVTAEGLMNGTGDGNFSPYITTDRAMLVTVLWRLEGSPASDSSVHFDDVADGMWYTDAIEWASANGIVKGYGNGLFGPADQITREQIMAILNRYAAYKKWTDDAVQPKSTQYKCSIWAEKNVGWAEMNGLLDNLGTDISDMTAKASRAELAAYLSRFMKNSMN